MIIYVIDKITFDENQEPITLENFHYASSIELAHRWIQENCAIIPEEEYDWFFCVYTEEVDADKGSEDQEFYIFDRNAQSIEY